MIRSGLRSRRLRGRSDGPHHEHSQPCNGVFCFWSLFLSHGFGAKMKIRKLRNSWLAAFLSNYQWYRKLAGGKWERWWVDHPVCSDVWHDVRHFTRERLEAAERANYKAPLTEAHLMNPYWWGFRPSPLCRGTPTEEDWG